MHLFLCFVWACLWMPEMSVYICASGRSNKSLAAAWDPNSSFRHNTSYLNCNLLSGSCLSHFLRFFFVFYLLLHFCSLSLCIYLFIFHPRRCFDWQGYCSGGWCLDTGWHCTAPWAHSQIREDIRNPSLHVLFNHAGWRENVFMEWTMEQIYCTFVCVYSRHVCVVTAVFSLLSSHDT